MTTERTAAVLAEIPYDVWMTRPVLNRTPGASWLSAKQVGAMLGWLANKGEIESRWGVRVSGVSDKGKGFSVWLIPSTSCPSTAAAECTTKPCAPPCACWDSSRAFWDTSSGKPVRRHGSWAGWKRRPWSRLLFGAETCAIWATAISTACGVWSISLLRARRVNRTAAPGSGAATPTSGVTATETARCRTRSESSTAYDPPWCSSRMFRSGLQADIFENSASNFATWVTTSRRRCSSLRRTLARLTSASEFSSSADWQTPNSCRAKTRRQVDGTAREDLLPAQAERWSTPDASPNAPSTGTNRGAKWGGHRPRLTIQGLGPQCEQWATPNAKGRTSLTPDEINREHDGGGSDLRNDVANWPSPAARDEKGPNGEAHRLTRERAHDDQLPNAAATWATPNFPCSPPGRDDYSAWAALVAGGLDAACLPAVESKLPALADGLGFSNSELLRLGGNGVVPLAAGIAFAILFTGSH